MGHTLDPRVHPYKRDVAAKEFEGQVTSEAFVDGSPHRVATPISDILSDQMGEARTSQALFGESFMVYQTEGYWAWGQLLTDGYVGWISALDLVAADDAGATHLINVPLTRATNTSIKVLGDGPFPMGACVRVSEASITIDGSSAPFAQTDAGAIPASHLVSLQNRSADWVEAALLFTNAPYVWGGRSALGVDCSALVQLALQQAGRTCPRDSDMQEADLGDPIDRASGLARGDLVFWPGHVGIMLDADTLFHANAYTMSTLMEPLANVEKRVGPARTVKRLG